MTDINTDVFLNANSDLFDGLSENDLNIPERLVFLKNENVQGTILDISEINTKKFKAMKLEMMITTGDHAGKSHELLVSQPKVDPDTGKPYPAQKKQWVEFLLALFTKEQILTKQVDFTQHVGKTLGFTAGEAREYNGKLMQNAHGYKLIDPTNPL